MPILSSCWRKIVAVLALTLNTQVRHFLFYNNILNSVDLKMNSLRHCDGKRVDVKQYASLLLGIKLSRVESHYFVGFVVLSFTSATLFK